jgi:saccharopine dehydrogenase-like NADP-dependent oxidoreductase
VTPVRLLVLGAGGVGSAAARIAARRPFLTHVVLADYERARAERAAAEAGDDRFVAVALDASNQAAIESVIREFAVDAVLGATDPRFTMPIFRAALATRIHYLDMAMSLSKPHPDAPYEKTGVKLGDEQFALADDWAASGKIALVGMGVEPGLADVFARYATDHLFSEIDEIGIRDGANLTVSGYDSRRRFPSGRPSRSASTHRSSTRRTAAGSPQHPSASRKPSTFPRESVPWSA